MTDFPPDFRFQMEGLIGTESAWFFDALQTPPVVSIRLNEKKKMPLSPKSKVPWCQNGYYLDHRPQFTYDPLFQAGCYYVQDASSMFMEQAVKQTVDTSKPLKVLDLCASPGGKTTHLLSLVSKESVVIANEVIRSRLPALKMNIEKWGYPNIILTNNDPDDFNGLKNLFDLVVVDAPCSGEGLFRKEPDAMDQWSPEQVKLCTLRQSRILERVWPVLKPGGILLYSTCTFNESENENNIKELLKKFKGESISISTDETWGITRTKKDGVYGYRFYPHQIKGEGFFLSIIRKGEVNLSMEKNHHYRKKKSAAIHSVFRELLKEPDQFEFREKNGIAIALPKVVFETIDQIESKLSVVYGGLALGSMKSNKIIPDHALALSPELRPGFFPEVELPEDEVLKFLRKEPITPFGSGITRFNYKNFGLGWGNVLERRVNNLLPTNYRILK